MTLTPSTIRNDLKCGKGAISKGEKCHKGPATEVSQSNTQKTIATVAVIGGIAAAGILGKRAWDARAANRLAQAKKSGFKPATPPPQSTYLSAGNNGKVYISKDRKSIFKITTNKESMSKFAQELTTQETVRALGVNTPKIRAADPVKGLVEMDFLDGYLPVDQALKNSIPQAQKSAIRNSLLSNMSKLHKAGWGHGDFHYKNVLYKDGNVAVIDWGNGSKNMVRIREDIWRTIQLSKDLSIEAERTAVSKAGKQFMDLSNPKQKDVDAFYDQLNSALNYNQRSDAQRLDLKCGKGSISKGEKCTKGPATKAAIAAGVGLTAGALALGAIALSNRGRARRIGPSGSTSAGSTSPSGPSPTPRLPGSSPRALLKSAPPRQSKTQRMRANTVAAMRNAEGRIAQTAREEIRRVGQIGNTMAAAGEATGMAAKTTMRELRLRTEAARRRFEPGYRSPDQRRLPGGSQPPLNNQEEIPSLEQLGQLSTEELQSWVLKDPRTGQPRRRRAQGFGRTDNYTQYYAPVRLQPPFRLDGPSTEYYRTHPEAAAKKVRTQAKINRRPEERERRAELNRERRKRGIDGQGGPDMSHTTSGRMVAEAPSTNRARNGHGDQPRLRKDSGVVFVTPRLVDPGRQDACWAGYVQAGMKRKGKKEVPNCVPASSGLKKPRAQRDAEGDGKKYTKVVTNPETGRKKRIRYGAKGYRIAPGTDKGDRYCARSFGDMKSHGKDCSGADRNTPLCLSRAKWKCSGKNSRRAAT